MGMSGGKSYGQWIRPEKRLAIYLRDSFACCYCGRNLKNARSAEITLDHLIPRSAGGNNEATNLVTACLSCNASRQDKPWIDFAPGGAVDRVQTLRVQPLNIQLAKDMIAGKAGNAIVESVR